MLRLSVGRQLAELGDRPPVTAGAAGRQFPVEVVVGELALAEAVRTMKVDFAAQDLEGVGRRAGRVEGRRAYRSGPIGQEHHVQCRLGNPVSLQKWVARQD